MTKINKLETLNYLLRQLMKVKDGDTSYLCRILCGRHSLFLQPRTVLREIGVTQKWRDSGNCFYAGVVFTAPSGNYEYNSFKRDVKIDIVKELIEELKQTR